MVPLQFVVISSDKFENDDEDLKNNITLCTDLCHRKEVFNFKACTGMYKGKVERSFLIDVTNMTHLQYWTFIVSLMKTYDQESILSVDRITGISVLHFSNGDTEHLGCWMRNDRAEDNYTTINGAKYSTKGITG